MKGINKCIILLFSFFIVSQALIAQVCTSVTGEAFPRNPQTGQYNYFGVRVSMNFTYNQNVTVTGYIHPDVDPGTNQVPFELTITAGNTSAETGDNFFQTDPTGGAGVTITSVSPCPVNEMSTTYAGVTITFEIDNNILRFNSASDLNAVLTQLDTDYENHNNTYDNNYDTSLTADQMDSIDGVTGFDEFYTFKTFENLFSGFTSKRMGIESTENTWLNNNFTGTDPDDIDLTFDEAENTVFNSDYSFKIGSDLYQLTSTGWYINGVLEGSASLFKPEINDVFAGTGDIFEDENDIRSGPWIGSDDNIGIEGLRWTDCKTNKRKGGFLIFTNDRYKLKVAIHTVGVRSSAKGKVVHFKLKNGNWKRKRAKMAVYNGGNIYSETCTLLFQFSERKPPNGWKKRRQLKLVRRQYGTIWKTKSGELVASFDTPVGHSGGIALTW
jgi:hypothetical protein